MKVGDLVRWYSEGHDPEGTAVDNGLVVQLSKTGHDSLSALILFENGDLEWVPDADAGLEVNNESR